LTILTYKAEEAGKQIVAVDAKNTSQLCSNCGELVPKKLSTRIHNCSCGYRENRDINAARNILIRAERLGTSLQGAVPIGAV